ncbi:MAG: 6-phosphofructokinase [Armatimonadetes bacterium]|nr:6-phosphofructokinase [Armatimonadota bacterium]
MRIGVLTGGGDCPGLNPAIRAVYISATERGWEVFGFRDGWRGLRDGDAAPLKLEDVEGIISRGGTILGSSRTNPMKSAEDLQQCKEHFRGFQLDALVAIGGDDTLSVAARLSDDGLPCVGIPKTMDNDLSNTDYTFGFDTAVTVAVDALERLRDTARSHHRVMVLEVMGRHAGWVAWMTALAGGADWVLIPEVEPDLHELAEHVNRLYARGHTYALVVASEGITVPEEVDEERAVDAFGHVVLRERNVGQAVAKEIHRLTGFETRHAVIGHIQRGGPPTIFDRVLATRVGVKAVEMIEDGDFGMMAAVQGNATVAVDIHQACGVTKTVPLALYHLAQTFFR